MPGQRVGHQHAFRLRPDHGAAPDDVGLVIPPRPAPIQVVVVPDL